MYYPNKPQRQKTSQIVIFIFFLILYCAQMVFAMLFLTDKYVAIMKLLFGIKKGRKNLSVLKKYKSGEEKIRLLYNYILQKQKSTNVQGEIYGM